MPAQFVTDVAEASGRATKELVRRGLNLGHAFKELQEKWGKGTEGGGHAVAAGIKFPKEKKEEFLEEIERIIERQEGKTAETLKYSNPKK